MVLYARLLREINQKELCRICFNVFSFLSPQLDYNRTVNERL